MDTISQVIKSEYSAIWKLSVFSFLAAGLTGFLYRLGFLLPLPEWLHLINIRHAHSHLMFFNWITPPVLIWMAAAILPAGQREIRKFKTCLFTMMALGFLTWPFFLIYGYSPVAIGLARLPLAAMLSGLVMLCWYWFAWLYYGQRKHRQNKLSLLLFDAALAGLIISSAGAWGVSVYQFSPFDNPLGSRMFTSFFLGVFTEGWVIPGILGIIWSIAERHKTAVVKNKSLLWVPLLLGATLIFPYSLNQSVLSPAMLYLAKTGLLLIAVSLILHLYEFIKTPVKVSGLWGVIILFLGVKVLFQLGALLPIDIWPGEHGMRILYLHLIFLGFGSTAIIQAVYPATEPVAKWIYVAGVLGVLVTLGMVSGYWPAAFIPGNLVYWLAFSALVPIFPMAWLLFRK